MDTFSLPALSAADLQKLQALRDQLEQATQKDPMLPLKMGAREINQRVAQTLQDARGVRVENVLTVLAALAGYACQVKLHAQAFAAAGQAQDIFQIHQTADGKRYYLGNALNQALIEDEYSLWRLAAGAAQHLGVTQMPDLEELFAHVANSMEEGNFGVPRLPAANQPDLNPAPVLKIFWPSLLPLLPYFCRSQQEWPQLFAIAVQDMMLQTAKVLPPALALQLVMEVAVPMSKLALEQI